MKIAFADKSGALLGDTEKVTLSATDAVAPKWQKIFPLGATKHRADFPGGKITFTKAFLSSMVANYEAEGKPRRAVNYFHKGTSDVAAAVDEKIAAGWITDLHLREDGLYTLIDWKERARAFILADEISYLSPEFHFDKISRITGKPQGPTLTGAALLNDPFLTELPRVAASENPGVNAMTPEEIRKLLKLAADANDDAVRAALTTLSENSVKLAESGTQAAVKLAETEAARLKLAEENTALAAKLETAATDKRNTEVKAFCDALISKGQITPAIRAEVEKLGRDGGVEAIKFFEKAAPVIALKVEAGVTGAAGGEDPKKAASVRCMAKLDELQGKGMRFTEAYAAVRSTMPEDFKLTFSAV